LSFINQTALLVDEFTFSRDWKLKKTVKERELSSSLYVCFLWFIEHKTSLLHHITTKKEKEKKKNPMITLKSRHEPNRKKNDDDD
jgi:hypothetical protein